MPRTTIKLESESDRWRYVCPNGHRSWEPTNEHYFCIACSRALDDDDIEPAFDELRDQKTGELLARDEVRLLTDVGPYEDVATDAGV